MAENSHYFNSNNDNYGENQMSKKDFEKGFYAEAFAANRIACNVRGFLREAWAATGIFTSESEGYLSVYVYPGEFIEEINKTKSAKDYAGKCWAPFLWFDIDRGEDDLPAAFGDAVKLVEHLVSLGLKKENIQIFFSGHKGVHVIFDMRAFGKLPPSEHFPQVCRRVAEMIAAGAGIEIDTAVYHHVAMLRLPNTLHPKSFPYKGRLRKIAVTLDELKESDAAVKITARAKTTRVLFDISAGGTPEGDAVVYVPAAEPVPALVEIWQTANSEIEARLRKTQDMPQSMELAPFADRYRSLQNPHDTYRIVQYLRAMPEAIEGAGGDRALYKVTRKLCWDFGLEIEDAMTIIQEHYNPRCIPPWEEKAIRHKCESAIKSPHPEAKPRGFLWNDGENDHADGWNDEIPDDSQGNESWEWRNRRNPDDFEPFPLDCLPDPVKQYVVEKSASLTVEPAALALLILLEAGACAGAVTKLRLGNDWLVAPIIWGAIIGVSGSKKSPVLGAVDKLVRAANDLFRRQHEEAMRKYRALVKASKFVKKDGEDGEQTLAELPPEPVLRKSSITNATLEALQQYVQAYHRGVLVKKDELASFFGDTTRNSRDGEASDWLSGHSGAPVNAIRKTVAHASVAEAHWSVVGGITPDEFRTQMRKGHRLSDGTLSRFCLVWPPDMQELSHEDVSLEAIQRMEAVMILLLAMDFVDGKPYEVSLSAEAKTQWQTWREEIHRESLTVDSDAESSFYRKSEELLARVALILHLLESTVKYFSADTQEVPDITLFLSILAERKNVMSNIPNEISGETMQRAEIATRWIMAETLDSYQRLSFTKPQDISEEILDIIRENPESMSVRDIGQKKRRYRSGDGKEQLEKTLDKLVKAGRLQCQTTKVGNGKAVLKYSIPPAQAG